MSKIPVITKIVARIIEVAHWVGAALLTAGVICSAAAPQFVRFFVNLDTAGREWVDLNIYGFEVTAHCSNGVVDGTAFRIFGICGIILLCLMAMVFRNLFLILKRTENSTPFQKDNVRMLREIGIFFISIPVVSLVASLIARLALGADAAELSVNMAGVFMGFVMLCLTDVFSRGMELEKDVDGLV